jgi:hypothetical protein
MNDEMEQFVQQTEPLFAEAAERARALPNNTVQVWPGGASFTSIQPAIDSIKDASPQKPYSVSVGAGTYKENVQMKANVFMLGAGQDQTIITAAPGPIPSPGVTATGVVQTAGDSGIGDLTITATGGIYGCWVIAMKVQIPGKFKATGVTFNANDGGLAGNNIYGITNIIFSTHADSMLHLGSCIINAVGTGRNALTTGMDGYGTGYITTLSLSTIISSTTVANRCLGVSTGGGSTSTLQNCTITAQGYALIDLDWNSLITANQCVINGPISPGVIVNKVTAGQGKGERPISRIDINMPE